MSLKSLREKHEWTQDQVAREAGISRSTYTNIETGRTRPSVSLAKKLGRLFEIEWTYFFEDGGEDDTARDTAER